MKTEELREMPEVELQARNRELRADLFHLNLHNSLDKLEKPHRIRQIRKDIARVETMLNSKARWECARMAHFLRMVSR